MLNGTILKMGLLGLAAMSLVASANDYRRGTAMHNSNVTSVVLLDNYGNVVDENQLGPVYTKFPELDAYTNVLQKVDLVVETEEGYLELFSRGEMILTLQIIDNTAVVVWARDPFQAAAISREWVNRQSLESRLSFLLRSCIEGKGPDQDQDQGQGKGKEIVTECETVTVVLNLLAPQEKGKDQDQDKGKDQDQDQDQGKGKGGHDQDRDHDWDRDHREPGHGGYAPRDPRDSIESP